MPTNIIKKTAMGASLIAMSVAAPAVFADTPAKTVNWEGTYAGVGLDISDTSVAGSTDYGGMYGGDIKPSPNISLGKNWQSGNVVKGIELSFFGGMDGGYLFDEPQFNNAYLATYDWNWAASISGRVGIANGRWLTYASAGVTYADLFLLASEDQPLATDTYAIFSDSKQLGFNAGFGVEYALNKGGSLGLEYVYTAFPSVFSDTRPNGATSNSAGDLATDSHTLRFTYNYYFGDGLKETENSSLDPSASWAGGYLSTFAQAGLILDDNLNGNYYGNTRAYSSANALGLGVGYNWQIGNFVYGAAVDVASGGLKSDSYYGDDYAKELEWNWLTTIRGRAGIATGDLLFYGTAGLAVADAFMGLCDTTNASNGCDAADFENTYDGTTLGLVAGIGAEYRLSGRSTIFMEYNTLSFPSVLSTTAGSTAPVGAADSTASAHFLKFGLNYSFAPSQSKSAVETHDWSGTYAGLAFAPQNQFLSAAHYDTGGNGAELVVPAAVTFGKNWQSGNSVWGISGDFMAGADEVHIRWDDFDYQIASQWNWSASIRGRVGIATGDALLYATAGVTVADIEARSCESNGPGSTDCTFAGSSDVEASIDDIFVGLTAGIGIEYAVKENMSMFAEYRYTGFSSKSRFGSAVASDYYGDFTNYSHGVLLGLNYKFGK